MQFRDNSHRLARVLGPWDAGALMVGIIIGSGIFATPPLIATHLGGVLPLLCVWTLGGLMALCGALCYAELSSRFPHTGGAYVFLREGYGRPAAFVFGWSVLLVTYPASVAGVSLVFAAYLARLVPSLASIQPWVAAATCLLLTVVNILGVRLGAWTLRCVTGAKILALLAIVLASLVYTMRFGIQVAPHTGASRPGLEAWALSLAAVLWAYEGWADGPTLAGEMKSNLDVARALVVGTLTVLVIYLLINLAYIAVLGIGGMEASDSVVVDVASRVFGGAGSAFVTVLVLVSTLGAMLGMLMSGSRVVFALARDGLFFSGIGRVHARFRTPATALALLGAASIAYALSGSFEAIVRYFVFVAGLWFLVIIASVFKYRRTGPAPFSIPWFPLPPLIYMTVTVGMLIQLLNAAPRDALLGLGIVLAAVPLYFLWTFFTKNA